MLPTHRPSSVSPRSNTRAMLPLFTLAITAGAVFGSLLTLSSVKTASQFGGSSSAWPNFLQEQQKSTQIYNAKSIDNEIICPASLFPPLPPPAESPSSAKGLPPYYHIHVCRGLGLAAIHIFKAGGTALADNLYSVCNTTTGEPAITYYSWEKNQQLPFNSLGELCSQPRMLCYTFYREPVSRFLSAYHELMRRSLQEPQPQFQPLIEFHLPTDAGNESKLESFHKFLNYVEAHPVFDPHISSQLSFLKRSDDGRVASGVAFFDLAKEQETSTKLICGSIAECMLMQTNTSSSSSVSCPYHHDGKSWRSREVPDYLLVQYSLKEEDVDDESIARIVDLYREDYCFFGMEIHPRAQGKTVNCQ